MLEDPLATRILTVLAGRYLPVMSDWVDVADIAAAIGAPAPEIDAHCQRLASQALVEYVPADENDQSAAALITVKGLLAIGRVP